MFNGPSFCNYGGKIYNFNINGHTEKHININGDTVFCEPSPMFGGL